MCRKTWCTSLVGPQQATWITCRTGSKAARQIAPRCRSSRTADRALCQATFAPGRHAARSQEANVISFNTTAKALATAKQWAQCLALLGAQRDAQIPMDIVSFNTLQHALAGGSCWQLALSSLHAAQRCQLRCDDASYSATIVACGRSSRLWHVLQLARQSRELSSVNAAISILEKARAWQRALSLAEVLHGREDVVTFTSLAHTLPAQELLSSLRLRRLQPTELTQVALRSAAARAGATRLGKCGRQPESGVVDGAVSGCGGVSGDR
ncbi:unnamed protein product [Durusdinium trenchii]|uniref:Uncharacterized protein n=1 Tax=Durusdinium trenchii TaxID=1381693 RepID=A0ABP0KNY7_9DINO